MDSDMGHSEVKSEDMESVSGNSECDFMELMVNLMPRRTRYPLDDKFFEDGDRVCNIKNVKQITVDEECVEFLHKSCSEFCCHIAGCTKRYTTVSDFEAHYNSQHRNVCVQCKKLYPTGHLLEIHILETHDSLFKVMAQHQPMYCCLVEGCIEKFRDPLERQNHLVRTHRYPKNFRFNVTNTNNKTKENTVNVDSDVKPPTTKIKYVPKEMEQNVNKHKENSKKKKQKHKKHWHQLHANEQMETNVNIEDVPLQDLMETLPET